MQHEYVKNNKITKLIYLWLPCALYEIYLKVFYKTYGIDKTYS